MRAGHYSVWYGHGELEKDLSITVLRISKEEAWGLSGSGSATILPCCYSFISTVLGESASHLELGSKLEE